jgi:hypothetical protein
MILTLHSSILRVIEMDITPLENLFFIGNSGVQARQQNIQDNLIANFFTQQINSGRMTIERCYRDFWSYTEDADLWGLPKDKEWRSLLPSWRKILTIIRQDMMPDNKRLLDSIVLDSFERALSINEDRYNPFGEDASLAGHDYFERISDFCSSYVPIDDMWRSQPSEEEYSDYKLQHLETNKLLSRIEGTSFRQLSIVMGELSKRIDDPICEGLLRYIHQTRNQTNNAIPHALIRKVLVGSPYLSPKRFSEKFTDTLSILYQEALKNRVDPYCEDFIREILPSQAGLQREVNNYLWQYVDDAWCKLNLGQKVFTLKCQMHMSDDTLESNSLELLSNVRPIRHQTQEGLHVYYPDIEVTKKFASNCYREYAAIFQERLSVSINKYFCAKGRLRDTIEYPGLKLLTTKEKALFEIRAALHTLYQMGHLLPIGFLDSIVSTSDENLYDLNLINAISLHRSKGSYDLLMKIYNSVVSDSGNERLTESIEKSLLSLVTNIQDFKELTKMLRSQEVSAPYLKELTQKDKFFLPIIYSTHLRFKPIGFAPNNKRLCEVPNNINGEDSYDRNPAEHFI